LAKGIEFVQLAHGADVAVASIAKTRGSAAAAAEEAGSSPEA